MFAHQMVSEELKKPCLVVSTQKQKAKPRIDGRRRNGNRTGRAEGNLLMPLMLMLMPFFPHKSGKPSRIDGRRSSGNRTGRAEGHFNGTFSPRTSSKLQ